MGCTSSKDAPADDKNAPTSVPEPASKSVDTEEIEVLWKPLHSAIRWNKSVEEVDALITSDDMANARDTGNGNYPLHIAAQNGHMDLVKLLLERKADINAQNNKLNTPLHMSLSYDYIEVSEYLISNGADGNIENASGIPARKGIDGDKCLPAVYLGEAQTTQDLLEAFKMCEEGLGDLDKASFACLGIRLKKSLGPEIWTSEVQEKLKGVMMKL